MRRGPWIFLALLAALLCGCASGPRAISPERLSWDARGRLHAVTERDANTNGYNWTAIYDGNNRRLATTSVLVSNGVAYAVSPTTINSYFDPQVEFLELGVSYGITTEWKLYGPDLNGVYGGLNGTGGFEAVSPYLNWFEPTISDFRGNILGVVTNGFVEWNPARPTGYGAVPGYRPPALDSGASISLASAWRGHWPDITGYYSIGARTYDPVSGRWFSFDPVWNAVDPNGMTFCGGDPVNGFDSDGRCFENAAGKALTGLAQFLLSVSNEEDAQPMDEQIAAKYEANYQYYGNSSLYALNATFNPAVSTELNAGEAFGGIGLNYNNSGQTLSYAQQVDAGGSSILGFGQTAGSATLIYGAGTLSVNAASAYLNSSVDASLPSEINWGGSDYLEAASDVNSVPGQLNAGVDYEAERLEALNLSKNTEVFQPTPEQVQSAAFQVIVGPAQYTPEGDLVGTIADSTEGGGLLEIKGGSSVLNSTYQLRLQTFNSLVNSIPMTIETTRPVNPTFLYYLQRWGVQVTSPSNP